MVRQESPVIKMDSYDEFLGLIGRKRVSREQFIEFGLEHVYMVDDDLALSELENAIKALKDRKDTQLLTIRRYGKNEDNQDNPYLKLYEKIFDVSLTQDRDNNQRPIEIMKHLFGCSFKSQHYQCAHVWGMTKNPIMFTALFNIVLIPRMFDPLTGHESRGRLLNEFQRRFKEHVKAHFKRSIVRYNRFLRGRGMEEQINRYYKECKARRPEVFLKNAIKEWKAI